MTASCEKSLQDETPEGKHCVLSEKSEGKHCVFSNSAGMIYNNGNASFPWKIKCGYTFQTPFSKTHCFTTINSLIKTFTEKLGSTYVLKIVA